MHYLKPLNDVFQQFSKDSRVNATHISLDFGFFYIWNYNRFPDTFFINREEVMSQSKIGSKSTYHRCIKELNHWKYIAYYPSHNPFKGSRVKLFQFGTSENLGVDLDYPKNEQASVSYININKHNINNNKPIYKKEIFNFFKKKNWSEIEAEKFFNHYESVGWKKSNHQIENWQAAAESWMLKATEFQKFSRSKSKSKQKNQNELPLDNFQDNLHTNKIKNYNEPL
jgi:hypothetical protein